MLRAGLSARTTNMPAVAYIAAMILRSAGALPTPLSASNAASPCTSAMSRLPASSSGMFSALPLVLRGCTSSVASVSLIVCATASPYTGKPPPGVAVPKVTIVLSWAWAAPMAATPIIAAAMQSIVSVMAILLLSATPVRAGLGWIRREAGPLDGRDGAVLVPVRGVAADTDGADRGPGRIEDQHAAGHRHEPTAGRGRERIL